MKFGYCSNLNFCWSDDPRSREIFDAILDAGYDYFETQLSNLLKLTQEQTDWFYGRLKDAGVPMLVNLLLFPNDVALVGPEMDLKVLTEHAKRVLPMAKEHGSELVVFGNGGTRRVREGLTHEGVLAQMEQILAAVEPIARANDIVVALEPLCTRETNMINTFAQGANLTGKIGSPYIKNVCDWYHVAADQADIQELIDNASELGHLHIANPNGRIVPQPSDDPAIYAPFVRAVRAIGYDKKCSVEAGVPEGADVKTCVRDGLAALKQIFA